MRIKAKRIKIEIGQKAWCPLITILKAITEAF